MHARNCTEALRHTYADAAYNKMSGCSADVYSGTQHTFRFILSLFDRR